MDRGRYRNHVRELGESAKLVESLAKVPDRATEKDFRQIVDQLKSAADDIEALLKTDLPGCSCRLIDHDDYSYLDYNESCRHHAQLFARQKQIKEHYAKVEKKLTDEVRLRLVTAALSSGVLVSFDASPESLGDRAIAIANATIASLLKIGVTPS